MKKSISRAVISSLISSSGLQCHGDRSDGPSASVVAGAAASLSRSSNPALSQKKYIPCTVTITRHHGALCNPPLNCAITYIQRAETQHIMATKRTHEDFESQEAVHESRQFQVYGRTPKAKPPKRPRRHEPNAHINKKQAHASSVNAIKKRLRDASRRLERAEDLPANVRVEDERAVAACHRELAAAQAEKAKIKMIKRYQMVRFFGMLHTMVPASPRCPNLAIYRAEEGREDGKKVTQAAVGSPVRKRSRAFEGTDARCRSRSKLH